MLGIPSVLYDVPQQLVDSVNIHVDAGADVFVADRYAPAIEAVQQISTVSVVDNDKIHKLDVDVYSPCALGGALSLNSLVEMQAPVVAGAANNQLENNAAGEYLFHKGIVYAPDYVINGGGIINVSSEYYGDVSDEEVMDLVGAIGPRLTGIFEEAAASSTPTNVIADTMARKIIAAAN